MYSIVTAVKFHVINFETEKLKQHTHKYFLQQFHHSGADHTKSYLDEWTPVNTRSAMASHSDVAPADREFLF